jgi:hypothetical protein
VQTVGTTIVAATQKTIRKPLTPKAREYLGYLQSLHAPDVVTLQTGMHFGEQEKYVTANFSERQVKEWGSIEVNQLTDMQFGHVCCNEKRLKEYIDWNLEKPNRFVVLVGDCIDAATIFSPGSPYENLFSPSNQACRFAELFAPLRHRILGYVGGNHERRGIPAFGDLGSLIATYLRVPYSAGKQHIDVHFGKHVPFKIELWHGTGSARTKGTVAQTLDRFMSQGDGQLYYMGHLHQPMVIPKWREERDGRGGIKLRKTIGVVGSSFLEFYGTYAEVKGLEPGDVMMGRAILYPDGGWEVTLK